MSRDTARLCFTENITHLWDSLKLFLSLDISRSSAGRRRRRSHLSSRSGAALLELLQVRYRACHCDANWVGRGAGNRKGALFQSPEA